MKRVEEIAAILFCLMHTLAASSIEAPKSFEALDYIFCSDGTTIPLNVEVVNGIIGAEAFYNYGIAGKGVKVANVELGVYWPEHSFFTDTTFGETKIPDGADISKLYSSHATGTASVIGGYLKDNSQQIPYLLSLGIAPLSTISCGAVAREINSDGTANVDTADFCNIYKYYFQTSQQDVISSSWGYGESSVASYLSYYIDAQCSANRFVTFVAATGNFGEKGANTVSVPALAYNGIAVGAVGNPFSYDTISSYSSYGPSDFYNPVTDKTISGVRPSVDICAPGDNILVAYYDSSNAEAKDYYSVSSGTSFATPIVSGVVALMKETSYQLEAQGATSDARDSRVIKAVLLNSAKKTSDWTNNQTVRDAVEFNMEIQKGMYYTTTFDNVIYTSQGLDYKYGAGIVDASGALKQYINYAQTGDSSIAWAFDTVDYLSSISYSIGTFDAGDILTATLCWMVESSIVEIAGSDIPDFDGFLFSNLRLELWMKIDGESVPVAVSDVEYNNVEHLCITLAALGEYIIRVAFFSTLYGDAESETFALAWSVVPEPELYAAFLSLSVWVFIFRRRI